METVATIRLVVIIPGEHSADDVDRYLKIGYQTLTIKEGQLLDGTVEVIDIDVQEAP